MLPVSGLASGIKHMKEDLSPRHPCAGQGLLLPEDIPAFGAVYNMSLQNLPSVFSSVLMTEKTTAYD